MKRFTLAALLAMFMGLAWADGTGKLILLNAGMENGQLPDGWTQESVRGQASFVVEDNTSLYPSGSYEGDYHLALRNQTGQTQRYVQRLISPVMDLRELYQPILCFAHAQAANAGDVDTLRVYYRNSADMRWVMLEEWGKRIERWQLDTIFLPATNGTYQVMFEGVDNFGRGLVLDNIQVRSNPACEPPFNFSAEVGPKSARLTWVGSLDAVSFSIKVSATDVEDPETLTAADCIYNDDTEEFFLDLSNLEQNTTYYAYIRSNCQNEVSAVSKFSFKTTNLQSLPYEEHFNRAYQANTISFPNSWTRRNSIGILGEDMTPVPFINVGTSSYFRPEYSVDSTSCLIFAGATDESTPIPAGVYAYAATPELECSSVSTLQARFSGMARMPHYYGYTQRIIVGVMTNPADYSTFVPVDTVGPMSEFTYDEFVVSFANYSGSGKHIAFVSDFKDKPNLFYLDRLFIEEAPKLLRPTELQITKVGGNSFTLSAKLHGADKANVLVALGSAAQGTEDVASLPDTTILVRQNNISLPATINLPAGSDMKFVQVYVQATDGSNTGEWSRPKKLLTPKVLAETDYPYTITFETSEERYRPSDLENYIRGGINYTYLPMTLRSVLTNRISWPRIGYQFTPTSVDGNQVLNLYGREISSDGGYYTDCADYVALPYVDKMGEVMLKFYMAETTDHAEGSARVEVGVMTDPFDPSTFRVLTTFDGSYKENVPCVVNMANHNTGNAHFIALRGGHAKAALNGYESISNVDHIVISKNTGCTEASDIKAQPTDNSCLISWYGASGQQWRLRMGTSMDNIMVDTTLSAMSFNLTGLDYNTTYYYAISASCQSDLSDVDIHNFKTDCSHAGEAIPFYEDFERFTVGGFSDMSSYPKANAELPCWTYPTTYYSSYYYPGVYHASWLGYNPTDTDGSCFGLGMGTSARMEMHVSLPRMSLPVKQLELRFLAKTQERSSAGIDTLAVGVMTDPEDRSTFVKVADVITNGDYLEYFVDFDSYTGTGEYITILSNDHVENRLTLIDNILVDRIPSCSKIQDVKISDIGIHGAKFDWTSTDASSWKLRISTVSTLKADTLQADQVVWENVVTSKPYVLNSTQLQSNVRYYAYVAPVCTDALWSNPADFKTDCEVRDAGTMGTIDFSNQNELNCWVVGLRTGTSAVPSRYSSGYLQMTTDKASDGAFAVMPPLDIDSIKRLELSFDAWASNNAGYARTLAVGVVTDPNDISTYVEVARFTQLPMTQANAQRYTVRFDGYQGDFNGNYGRFAAFLNEAPDVANYVYIDNVRFDTVAACQSPAEVVADTIGVSMMQLSWKGNAAKYELRVEGSDNYQLDTIMDKTSLTLTGLGELTSYTMSVRSICTPDSGLWSNPRTYTTICPPEFALPFVQDFNSVASGQMPSCWDKFYNGNQGAAATYPRVYSDYNKNDENVLNMYIYGTRECVTVSPVISTFANATLSFDYYRGATAGNFGIIVGVASEVETLDTLMATATVIDTITINDPEWSHYAVDLSAYQGKGRHIVLMGYRMGTNGSVYIDNIRVTSNTDCTLPLGLTADVTATTATLSWKPEGSKASTGRQWLIQTVKGGTAETITVDTTSYTLTGLTASTSYTVRVATLCGAADTTEWVAATFTTPCEPAKAGSVWNFRNGDPTYAYTGTYRVPECWDGGKGNGSSASYRVNITNNTTSYTYSIEPENTSDGALRFYQNASNYNQYVVLPDLGISPDSAVLQFFGRPARYNASTKKFANVSSNLTLQVGTISDPTNFSTFEKITEVTYTKGITTSSEPDSLYGFEEFNIPLRGFTNGRVAIVYPRGSGTQYYCIDSVSILPADVCAMGLITPEVKATSADLNWTETPGDTAYVVCVSAVEDFASVLYSDTVKAFTAHVDGLLPNTTYYYRLKHLCGEDSESAFRSGSFITPATIRFSEDFSRAVNVPANWTRYDAFYQSIMGGTHFLNNEPKTGSQVNDEYFHAWNRTSQGGGMMVADMSDVYNTHFWLMTPSIDLTQVPAGDSLMLSFDLMMTTRDGAAPNTATNKDDMFAVVVSHDNGLTWREADSYQWKPADETRNLNSFSEVATKVQLDLSACQGQTIKVVFYAGGSTDEKSSNYLFLDNVQLNRYSVNSYESTICQFADYEDEQFRFTAEELLPGQHEFEEFVPAKADGQSDMIQHLSLHVTAAEQVDLYATTCEGTNYQGNDFVVTDPLTGVYRRKFNCVNGCDSIVNLHLTVTPVPHVDLMDTICQGQTYTWNGHTYQTTTIETQTLTSSLGCDSVVTLYLNVRPAPQSEEQVVLCHGQQLTLGSQTITAAGTYTATVEGQGGCDSVVTWHVTEVPALSFTVRAAICEGDTYSDGTFVGLSREDSYSLTLTSSQGCDSVANLHLFVVGNGDTRRDTIETTDLPYVINGTTLLSASTAEGQYMRNVTLSCGSTFMMIVQVGRSTGLYSRDALTVGLTPNPVSAGQQASLTGLPQGMNHVEVHDVAGRLVMSTTATTSTYMLPALTQAGVYMVQVTAADGSTAHLKLVVK